MKRNPLVRWILFTLVLLALSTPAAQAELRQVQLRVDGLACPFCAYGLEKNLKALKGVREIKIDMEEGVVTLLPKDGKLILAKRLREVVKDSGFTLRRLDLVVVGRITTFTALKEDSKVMKAVEQIQKAAKEQGLELPANPFVLQLEKSERAFLLLKSPDETQQSTGTSGTRPYQQLAALAKERHTVVVTGRTPLPEKGKRRILDVLFVERITPPSPAP